MTAAEAILNLLTEPRRTREFMELPYGETTVRDALYRLKRVKCIRRVRYGVWVKTGKPYEPWDALKRTGGPRECAEALGISRQWAYKLIKEGLAWKEDGQWVRKHTKPGRPR